MGATSGYLSSISTGDNHPWRNAFFGGAAGFTFGLRNPVTIKNAMHWGAIVAGSTNAANQWIDYSLESKPISLYKIAKSAYIGGLMAGMVFRAPIIPATIITFGPETTLNKLGDLIYEHYQPK